MALRRLQYCGARIDLEYNTSVASVMHATWRHATMHGAVDRIIRRHQVVLLGKKAAFHHRKKIHSDEC